jgi:hypothetical protein
MLAKQTWTKRLDQSDESKPNPHARPAEERYRLRVDGQEKRSFKTKEAAAVAGQVIKKAFPAVVVTLMDAETGERETVAA